MSYSVDVIRGSTVYSLSDGNPFWALTMTGLGLPPVRLLKERGAQQHGSTVVGFLLDERLLNLIVLIDAPTEAIAAQYRRDLAKILKPIRDVPCTLRITANDDTVRQIDTSVVGVVDFPNNGTDRFAGKQNVIVQLEASDPIPYDPTLRNIIFDTSGGSGYQVPLEVPMRYGTGSAINGLVSYTYAGDWEVYPKIYLTGPGDDFVITNETTGEVLDLTGASIPGGTTWLIDLTARPHVITDAADSTIFHNDALTDDSDLATWRLSADPEAPGGVNDIRVQVSGSATAATQVRAEFYDKYPSLG